MGIITRGLNRWKAKTTEEKVQSVLDFVCGWGMGSVCGSIANRFTAGRDKFTRIAAAVSMSGIGMIAGDYASKALMENLGKPCIEIGKTIKAKAAEAAKKEETENGEHPYTRY